jgi:hypothetical protein
LRVDGLRMGERAFLRPESFELAEREAALAGVPVGVWLSEAAVRYVDLRRALREQEAREGPQLVPLDRLERIRRGIPESEWPDDDEPAAA